MDRGRVQPFAARLFGKLDGLSRRSGQWLGAAMGFSCLYEVRVVRIRPLAFTGASYSHMTEGFDLHQRCVAVKSLLLPRG